MDQVMQAQPPHGKPHQTAMRRGRCSRSRRFGICRCARRRSYSTRSRASQELIMANALHDLAAAGVAVWLDDLSRTRIHSGSLARMVKAGEIVGITTNPTIFAKAIGSGSGYEDQLHDLALRGTSIGETLRLLT